MFFTLLLAQSRYNLRSYNKSGVVDITKELSKEAVEIDHTILFTYTSPFFNESIDITQYDYVFFQYPYKFVESIESWSDVK